MMQPRSQALPLKGSSKRGSQQHRRPPLATKRVDENRPSASPLHEPADEGHAPAHTASKSSLKQHSADALKQQEHLQQMQEELARKEEDLRVLHRMYQQISVEYSLLKTNSETQLDQIESLLAEKEALKDRLDEQISHEAEVDSPLLRAQFEMLQKESLSLEQQIACLTADKQSLEVELKAVREQSTLHSRLDYNKSEHIRDTVSCVMDYMLERTVCGAYKSLAVAAQQQKFALENSLRRVEQELEFNKEILDETEFLEAAQSKILEESVKEHEVELLNQSTKLTNVFESRIMILEDELSCAISTIKGLESENSELRSCFKQTQDEIQALVETNSRLMKRVQETDSVVEAQSLEKSNLMQSLTEHQHASQAHLDEINAAHGVQIQQIEAKARRLTAELQVTRAHYEAKIFEADKLRELLTSNTGRHF